MTSRVIHNWHLVTVGKRLVKDNANPESDWGRMKAGPDIVQNILPTVAAGDAFRSGL